MDEQMARNVVLVRAIETADVKREVLSDDDRMYASRSARELAQWQAAEGKTAATSEHFLQQRAEQIIKRLSERTPAFASVVKRRALGPTFNVGLPVLALVFGAVLDRIGDPHRVDLLSAPLLGIIGWNLLVYLGLLIALVLPRKRSADGGSALLRRITVGRTALPRRLPGALSSALAAFMTEWTALSARLSTARLARTLHLAAALFALGAVFSLYARGMLSQYVAGWESTFLDAGQVHGLLSALFTPAVTVFPLQGFTLADIEALRFGQAQPADGGARWVHLYGATLVLLVVLPRLLLAGVSHWRASRLAKRFPLDLDQPYFRKLAGESGLGEPALVRVLPYSFTLDEVRDRGLAAVAVQLFGANTRVMLRPSSAYGEEAIDQLRDAKLDDPQVSATVIVFNLAATPEKENHGVFIEHVRRAAPRGFAVLLDESALVERATPVERAAERIALWQQFCRHHGADAIVVNLLHPEVRPLDAGVELGLAKAP
ncbi:MAG: DUF2868 domain-containing protein [Gammaproteobacteria bacterium]